MLCRGRATFTAAMTSDQRRGKGHRFAPGEGREKGDREERIQLRGTTMVATTKSRANSPPILRKGRHRKEGREGKVGDRILVSPYRLELRWEELEQPGGKGSQERGKAPFQTASEKKTHRGHVGFRITGKNQFKLATYE